MSIRTARIVTPMMQYARLVLAPFSSSFTRAGQTLQHYNANTFRQDFLAGLTVAVVAVPQAMAYAIIAQVPPEYGLYSLIFYAIIGTIFCSQPLAALGPINTQSLLIASIITRLAAPELESAERGDLLLQLAIVLALLKGLMQLVMTYAKLGSLVKYVSQSVIVGFTAGAGILIAAGQIKGFLGTESSRTVEEWPALIGIVQQLVPSIPHTSFWAICIGTLTLAIVLGSRFISQFMPGPLIALIVSGISVWLLGLTQNDLTLIAPLSAQLPMPSMPSLGLLVEYNNALLSGALALALLGLMESYAVAKNLSAKNNVKVDANRELFAQGLTNFAGSFFHCIPGSSSFARSALNAYAGGKTFLSGVFCGVLALVIYLVFAPFAKYVPMAAIAAVLFVIAYSLINFGFIHRVMRTSKADTYACYGTLIATLVFPLEYAVFIGIFLNIALYLRRSSQLHIAEMVRMPEGPYTERPLRDRHGNDKVLFLQVEGDLYFAVADELENKLMEVAQSPVRVVILRMKRTHWIDTTVLTVLERFVDRMRARDAYVLFCGMRSDTVTRMEHFGLLQKIGKENIFESSYGVFTSAKRAIQRAKVLVGSSIDADILAENECEEWSYQI